MTHTPQSPASQPHPRALPNRLRAMIARRVQSRQFWPREDGAATVDWVVLVGAVITLCTVFMTGFSTQVVAVINTIFAGL